ncbi:MAG: CotH kinase family protein, partial [Nitrososphaeraceae archaeon]
MFKKKDIPVIILLFVILIAAILFWASYRETFKIGKTAAFIDNSSKTIIVNLEDNSDKKQVISFNFPFNNENIYIKPVSYGTKKIINSYEQKLTDGLPYDFKDFIFQGKIIKKTGDQKIEYNLLVTSGNLPIIKIDTADQKGSIQGIPSNKDGSARLECKLNIISSESGFNQSNVGIEINTLGNASNQEKISYSFNIKENTIKNFTPKILDFEDSKSFKLNPLKLDPSLMRIKLSYDIFNMLKDKDHMDIASKSEYVEVFVDNEYKGVYLLEERVNNKLFNLPKYKKKDLKHSVIYEAEETFANFTNGIQGFTQKEP